MDKKEPEIYPINTLEYSKRLQKAGMPEKQADTVATMLQECLQLAFKNFIRKK